MQMMTSALKALAMHRFSILAVQGNESSHPQIDIQVHGCQFVAEFGQQLQQKCAIDAIRSSGNQYGICYPYLLSRACHSWTYELEA